MTAIKFKTIWDNYPSSDPCRGKDGKVPKAYENQCAIKVGYALEKSGISFAAFQGGRCPNAPKDSGMVASAQGLAKIGWAQAVFLVAQRQKSIPVKMFSRKSKIGQELFF